MSYQRRRYTTQKASTPRTGLANRKIATAPYRKMNSTFRKAAVKRKYTAPMVRRRRTRLDNTHKLVGQEPESAVTRIARDYIGPIATIAKTVAGIAELVNAENKFVDTVIAGSINNIPNYGQRLTIITPGDGVAGQRDGNSVLMQNLYGRLYLTPSTTTNTINIGLAIILLKDCQAYTAATPLWDDVFKSSGGNILSFAPINKDFSNNFVILKRWNISTHANHPVVHIKFKKSLKNIHIGWQDDSTTLQKNHIYFIGRTDSADTITPTGVFRLSYTDN